MLRSTRSHTIRRYLVEGALVDLGLDEATQKAGPYGHDTDGFSVRQHIDADGTLVVIAAAFGPDWFATMRDIRYRLERPYLKCHVDGDAPELDVHELRVRWATSEELRARAAAEEKRQAPVKAMLRRQSALQRAEEERQSLEAAGQSGLF
ncbi:hypothetical protein ACIP93_33570 [Streptomyces sp. NPDC088745]|uniref:hypothetical protein n=1 Tax=Streptomyces sp. NPDC088745 TaxID=3365884 RepID=UPI00380F0689